MDKTTGLLWRDWIKRQPLYDPAELKAWLLARAQAPIRPATKPVSKQETTGRLKL